MLVASLLPVYPARAAVAFTFDSYSTDPNAPTQVNQGTISIKGSYHGVSPETISYKVELLVNGKVEGTFDGAGVSPILTGINRFEFPNVTLFTGLNRVTVSGYASGSIQSNSFYVYFPNVPTIYDIELTDGRKVSANQPTLVTTSTVGFMFKAPNATNVTVQGRTAFSGGTDMFFVSGIELKEGLNKIVFVASNATNTYSITRDIVRLYGTGTTVYDLAINNGGTRVELDGNPVVTNNTPAGLTGVLTGKIALPIVAGNPVPDVNIEIIKNNNGSPSNLGWDNAGTPAPTVYNVPSNKLTVTDKLSVTGTVYDYQVYTFTTDPATITITDKDTYTVKVSGQYGTSGLNFITQFEYRSQYDPYIADVKQLYNVNQSGSSYTYTSSSDFSSGLYFFQLPIWLGVDVRNLGGNSVVVKALQDGVESGALVLGVTDETEDGLQAIRVDNLPSGELTLQISVENGGFVYDSRSFEITYVPTPFIEITNFPNNAIFNDPDEFNSSGLGKDANGRFADPAIKGRLVNFNLNGGDMDTLTVTINGAARTVSNAAHKDQFVLVQSGSDYTGEFEFNNYNDSAAQLVFGPNTITISAYNGNIPVSVTYTVFLFPANVPAVISMKPVPVGEDSDDSGIFESTGELQYTTTERNFEVIFEVANADQVVVSLDGLQHALSNKVIAGGQEKYDDDAGKLVYLGKDTNTLNHKFRLLNVSLPDSGTKSVTVMAAAGTTTSTMTLQITRIRMPYRILSPSEEERVVNQNFLVVAIEAEGADRILLGKEPMVKGSDNVFRLELLNKLKSGNNKIDFTIYIGSEQQKGSFNVVYAAQNEVGGQYKAIFPTSGKLTAFNGALTITVPRGTMLKQPQDISATNTSQVRLFSDVPVLIGIADKQDGRTIKRYNRVAAGEGPGGNLMADINANATASGIIQGTRNFGFASELFWIDAGYYDAASGRLVPAMHPYSNTDNGNDIFYLRSTITNKWLVPTNRGTITLKYDPSIRNEAARNLSIWHYTGGAWKNLGGVVNTGNKTITASFDGFGYYAVMTLRYGFEDITGHPYARNHLNTMFAKGIMDPRDPVSSFGVYENITRGEFATMIVKILDLPLNYSTSIQQLTFSDVPPVPVANALWDYRYIETAARAGIVSGLAPRQFAPSAYLTREQAATIIARALNYKLGTPEKDRESLAKQFTDAGLIDYYAVTAVQAVVKDKIMSGVPNPQQPGQKQTFSFNPKANLNRADMAIIAYNIMTKLKRI